MAMLKINGTYCRVGIPPASDISFSFDYIPLIFTEKKITGSIVTGTTNMARMLQLAKDEMKTYEDTDEWTTELVPFEQVNEAIAKLSSGQNGNTYRYLLKW
jgi:D-arabinose 1-dehydrogenase-like Zn-dependent alcohol dehydrogenase